MMVYGSLSFMHGNPAFGLQSSSNDGCYLQPSLESVTCMLRDCFVLVLLKWVTQASENVSIHNMFDTKYHVRAK